MAVLGHHTRLLNSISSGTCRQNTPFNMYTTTSKQQEGYTFKDSHPKCFITTNSTAKLSPGAVNRGDVHVLSVIQRSIRIHFVIIRRNGLSIACCKVIVRCRSVRVRRK